MIDIPNDPEAPLGSWFITTATCSNTEFQSPAHIPNGSRCTVRSGALLVWGHCMENIPANNEVEECLCLLERMETCLTWTLLVFQRVFHMKTDGSSQSLSITATSLAWYSSSLGNKCRFCLVPQRDLHMKSLFHKNTLCCYYITHWLPHKPDQTQMTPKKGRNLYKRCRRLCD